MNRDRIDLAVVSAVGGIAVVDLLDEREQQPIAREANEQIVALAERHPGRFAGLAVLPMRQPERAVEELEHAAKIGLKGAMVYAHVAGTYLDAPKFRPVFEAAERLGLVIQIHPTHPRSADLLETGFLITAVGYLFDTTTATLRLIQDGIYDSLPELKLHLSHAGSLLPYVIERIDFQAGLFAQDVAKLSGAPSEYIAKLYTDLVCSWVPALRDGRRVLRCRAGHVRDRRSLLARAAGARDARCARALAGGRRARAVAHGHRALRPRALAIGTDRAPGRAHRRRSSRARRFQPR